VNQRITPISSIQKSLQDLRGYRINGRIVENSG